MYPKEQYCDSDYKCPVEDHPKSEHGWCEVVTDDGTMQQNVDDLADKVVGHRIVSAEQKEMPSRYSWREPEKSFVLTLDNGKQVVLQDTDDCCACTELNTFLLHPDKIDHIITGVGTTDGFSTWHVFADFGDVLEFQVNWSAGNPFYYSYGFDIAVVDLAEVEA